MRHPLILAFFCASTAPAATIVVTDSTVSTIPDGSSSGVARSLSVSAGGQAVASVEVDLNLSAAGGTAFLGDLYVYLTDGTHLSVLADRPGRRVGAPAGYSDNQSMTVTFSGAGANDFHNYRIPLTGSNTTPISGPLTGIWQADGRATDPGLVLETDARSAQLSVFNGVPADGTWSLFAADLSTGAVHQINSWTLRIQTIPEPATSAVAGLAALTLLMRRRRS
jgi:subtilisin-like proprotein convertase family protein